MTKKVLLATFAMLCIAGTALAAPIALPQNAPLFFQFNNLEQVDQTLANRIVVPGGYNGVATQGNWGVVNISSIQNGAVSIPHTDIAGGPVFFADDGPGGTSGQITGIFYGVQLASGTKARGGILDLFWQNAGSDTITAACLAGGCGPNAATVAAFTAGTFLARLDFASGIISGDPLTTIASNSDLTISVSGHADSFANVDKTAGGAWADVLNGDWFFVDTNGDGTFGGPGETRDVRFSNFFNGLPSWNGITGIVGLRSNDPARVLTVPEPGTLTLLGLGLLGLRFAVGRRKK